MIQIEKLIPGGQALATLDDGKKAFFWNALPGEIVTDYEVTKNKSHYLEAIATKIDSPSPHRVTPRDEESFLSTSPWQIMDYAYELSEKQALVVEIFREHGIKIDTPEIVTDGKDYFYRNKMEYALYWDKDKNCILPAFHARGSHRKIPVTSSSIERPELFTAAARIIDDLNACHEEARKYQSLLLRCNQNGEISGGLFENKKPHPKFPHLTDTILDYEYSYSPNGFFQINLPVYELALTEIKHHIATDQVLDLYAGVGTIGLSTARNKSLTLVECDKSAFTELERNSLNTSFEGIRSCEEARNVTTLDRPRLTRSGLSEASPVTTGRSERVQSGNILAIFAKSEDVTSYVAPDQTVILDPPRAGCDQYLIARLLEVMPTKIIYLSCNPATQARDVRLLLEKYRIDKVKTFNFFPHTPHIENLVVLSLV